MSDEPRVNPQGDVVCEHGQALDVHCCHCHSGFIFDPEHECPPPPTREARPRVTAEQQAVAVKAERDALAARLETARASAPQHVLANNPQQTGFCDGYHAALKALTPPAPTEEPR